MVTLARLTGTLSMGKVTMGERSPCLKRTEASSNLGSPLPLADSISSDPHAHSQ